MANKVTTLGYTIKRLKDSGYTVYKLFAKYSKADSRAWTIVIDPGNTSVLCTSFVNDKNIGDSYIELYDGNQYIPGKRKIKTSSFEVLVEHLYSLGIYGNSATKSS